MEEKDGRTRKDERWRITSSSQNDSILIYVSLQYSHGYFTGIATSLNIYAIKKIRPIVDISLTYQLLYRQNMNFLCY